MVKPRRPEKSGSVQGAWGLLESFSGYCTLKSGHRSLIILLEVLISFCFAPFIQYIIRYI
jgi:hypothetical protein